MRGGGVIRLLILRPSGFGVEPRPREAPPGTRVVPFSEVKGWLRSGHVLRQLFRYSEAELATHRVDHVSKPFPTALLLRGLSHGRCSFSGDSGEARRDRAARPGPLPRQLRTRPRPDSLAARERPPAGRPAGAPAAAAPPPALDLARSPLYLRGDLQFGLRSGGSVGHIAGVLNNLERFAARPVFVTSDRIPTVRPEIETHVVGPGLGLLRLRGDPGRPLQRGSSRAEAERALAGRRVSFVYQRYGLYTLAGLELALRLGVPFVLEYNGSEVWIGRHWGRRPCATSGWPRTSRPCCCARLSSSSS